MARLSTGPTRLLGFAPLETIEPMQAAVAATSGPPPWVHRGPGIAALLQDEPATPMMRQGRKAMLAGLQSVHRRLEIACQLGAFLPADPSCACIDRANLRTLLDQSWTALAPALAEHGGAHQWDVVLRWSPESVLAAHKAELAAVAAAGQAALAEAVASVLRAAHARRGAILSAALAQAVLGVAAGGMVGTETEVCLTVLVPCGGEAAMEGALEAIPEDQVSGASVDLRGPMPPVSFHAVRLLRVEQGDIARSWRILNLGERADARSLHQQWRMMAAGCHPDRDPDDAGSPNAFSDIGHAYRLLRPLLREQPQTLRGLLRHAGYRLELPDLLGAVQRVPEQVA
jgi:hypothetical protein